MQTTIRSAPAQGGQVLCAVEHQVGAGVKSSLSLSLAGSPSMALTTTVPPAPRTTGERQLDRGGEGPTAAAGQTRSLEAGHEALLPRAVARRRRHIEWAVRVEVAFQVARMPQQLM